MSKAAASTDDRYRHYAARLRQAMADRKITNEIMAERLDSHPVTVSKLRNGKLRLDDDWRAKAAEALAIPEDVLFSWEALPAPRAIDVLTGTRGRGRPSTRPKTDLLPLFGMAAGSMQGAFSQTSEPVEQIVCPPGLLGVPGAYALRTKGTSMMPRYMPGEFLYIHPHQRISKGDHVVIQVQRHEGAETETWIKLYEGEKDGAIIVSQYNPVATIEFRKRFVLHMHRVLPPNEIYGLA